MQSSYLLFQSFAFATGLCVGSFMNVCIARMPEDRSVVRPPSHCPACGSPVRPRDNIPVLSWMLLRGRCRTCKTSISPLYPIIELLVGVLALLLFRHLVPDIFALTVPAMAAWAVYTWFLAMLVGITYVDLRHYIIPDQFSIYAVPVGVAASIALGWLGWPEALTWKQSVVGALIGGGVLLAVMGAYWVVRREEGMGFGDVKLLAMMGAFLGAMSVPVVILLSSTVGSIVGIGLMITGGRGFRAQVPFGPFLALAGVIYLFYGEEILNRFMPGFVTLFGG